MTSSRHQCRWVRILKSASYMSTRVEFVTSSRARFDGFFLWVHRLSFVLKDFKIKISQLLLDLDIGGRHENGYHRVI